MADKKRKFRFPIILKTAIIIFIFSIIVVEVSMTYYSLVISNRNKETYKNYADSLSSTIAKVVDADDINILKDKVISILETIPNEERIISDCEDEEKLSEYIAKYDSLYDDAEFVTVFERTRNFMRNILESHEKFYIDCAYISYVYTYTDENGVKQGIFVYLVDTAPEEDACPPGWLDPLFDFNRPILETPERGMPAYTTNTSYGYLISAGSFVSNTGMGYACVDISMNVVRAAQAKSIIRLFVYLVTTITLLAAVGLLIVYFFFSRPLKKVTKVASSFDNNNPEASHQDFKDLKAKTRDELGELTLAVKAMEEGVVQRINELVELNTALIDSEKQTEKMTVLANRDALTSVGSKTAYDIEVEKINEQIANKEEVAFGIAMIDLNYLKNTNDAYGHIAGDEALVKLANVICLTFKHSPVYRIGGDEFVVILRNNDYKNAFKLIDEFNERIQDSIANQKLKKQERISAAIGFASYNARADKCVDDVFKRADEKMYCRKRKMKEEADKNKE